MTWQKSSFHSYKVLHKIYKNLEAVEPAEAMRAQFKHNFGHIPIVGGTAEEIPHESETFDAIFIGQAFHCSTFWFMIVSLRFYERVCQRKGRGRTGKGSEAWRCPRFDLEFGGQLGHLDQETERAVRAV